jgi:hypothetical protein
MANEPSTSGCACPECTCECGVDYSYDTRANDTLSS